MGFDASIPFLDSLRVNERVYASGNEIIFMKFLRKKFTGEGLALPRCFCYNEADEKVSCANNGIL